MPTRMDPRMAEAIVRNDKHSFTSLVHWNEGILEQRDAFLNTVLHLATRFGHSQLVEEIVKLRPDLVLTENEKQETAMHEACRQGNAEVLMLLLNTNPLAATMLNKEDQSAFLLACKNGHLNVAKLLMKQSWLMEFEEDRQDATPLHLAIAGGHMDIVEEILEVRPCFARKVNKNGLSPLHFASSRGHLEITKLLLSLDFDLALQYDNNGHTPVHLAVINGYVSILEAFLSSSPTSFGYLTEEGETIFHLAIRFDRYKEFTYLAGFFNFTRLLHQKDKYGNTILHLAVLRENYQTAKYIIGTTSVDINHQNHDGYTARDILENSGRALQNKELQALLEKAGCKCSIKRSLPVIHLEQISPPGKATEIYLDVIEEKGVTDLHAEHPTDLGSSTASNSTEDSLMMKHQFGTAEDESRKESMVFPTDLYGQMPLSKSCGHSPALLTALAPRNDVADLQGCEPSEPELSPEKGTPIPRNLRLLRRVSERHRKELTQLHRSRCKKEYEMYREAALNARNTIILVAILIATVTFSAGVNPPSGFIKEGQNPPPSFFKEGQNPCPGFKEGQNPSPGFKEGQNPSPGFKEGNSRGTSTAFKVFQISNGIALISSLGIVIFLVSIIPFRRKTLMKLVVISHRLMWVAVSFTATAYISATWVVVPQFGHYLWLRAALLALTAGSLGILFIYLAVSLAVHRLRKLKWREQNCRKKKITVSAMKGKIQSRFKKSEATSTAESTNSDIDSMKSYGYIAY